MSNPLRFSARIILASVIFSAAIVTPAVAGAASTSQTPSPCSMLSRSDVEAVGPAKPIRRLIPEDELAVVPPHGMGCDWISPTTAHRDPKAIFGVGLALWDFRKLGPAWSTRWGTKSRKYAQTLCNERPPPGSGVRLPTVHVVRGVGDYACATDTSIQVAKGPFYLIVSLGLNAPNSESRQTLIQLARKASGRLPR